MSKWSKTALTVSALLLATGAVAQEKKPAPTAKASEAEQKGTAPAEPVEAAQAATGQVETAPRAVPAIRRDPFRPFTLNLRTTVRRRDNLSPLEQFEIPQLKLVGIIRSGKEAVALVEDNIGRGYTVRVGTPIGPNDGRVKAITAVAVQIEEEYLDLFGARKKREVSMTLPAERLE